MTWCSRSGRFEQLGDPEEVVRELCLLALALRASFASGSVVDARVSLLRFSPWKSTVRLGLLHVEEPAKQEVVIDLVSGDISINIDDCFLCSPRIVREVFGWLRTVGNSCKTRYIGLGANQVAASMLASAYNLLRIAKLLEAP